MFFGAQISDKSIAEYIMTLFPSFWRPFFNGGHFQSNMSISKTKNRRALHVYYNILVMWRVGSRKRIGEFIMSLHLPVWRPFLKNGYHLKKMAAISKVVIMSI